MQEKLKITKINKGEYIISFRDEYRWVDSDLCLAAIEADLTSLLKAPNSFKPDKHRAWMLSCLIQIKALVPQTRYVAAASDIKVSEGVVSVEYRDLTIYLDGIYNVTSYIKDRTTMDEKGEMKNYMGFNISTPYAGSKRYVLKEVYNIVNSKRIATSDVDLLTYITTFSAFNASEDRVDISYDSAGYYIVTPMIGKSRSKVTRHIPVELVDLFYRSSSAMKLQNLVDNYIACKPITPLSSTKHAAWDILAHMTNSQILDLKD